MKYVLVPSEGEYTVVIEGEDNGVYTHTLTTLTNEVETIHHTYTAPVTSQSMIQYTKNNGIFSTIKIDEDGDGHFDKEMTLTGEVIESEVTYSDLTDAINELNLPRGHTRLLVALVIQAERLSKHNTNKHWSKIAEDQLLRVVEIQIARYKKMKLITEMEKQRVDELINKLINQ